MSKVGVAARAKPIPFDEFVAELDAIVDKHHVCKSNFIRAFVDGRVSADVLPTFLKEYYWGLAFDGFFAFASVAANMPPRYQRADYFGIMRNLGSEAGVGTERGMNHDDMQLLLPRHLGITDEEMYDHVASAPTQGFRHTVVACSYRCWETSVACIPYTVEGQGGEMHRLMWEGFRNHFDYPDDVMDYWRVHDELEGEHGEVGHRMLEPACETAGQQWRVRDAVTATCLTYRAMWDQFDALIT